MMQYRLQNEIDKLDLGKRALFCPLLFLRQLFTYPRFLQPSRTLAAWLTLQGNMSRCLAGDDPDRYNLQLSAGLFACCAR